AVQEERLDGSLFGSPHPAETAPATFDDLLRAHVRGPETCCHWSARPRICFPRLYGEMYSVTDGVRVGTYTPNKDNNTRWLLIDFDGGKKHPTALADPWPAAREALGVCKNLGIPV